jgi:hypothetical protein
MIAVVVMTLALSQVQTQIQTQTTSGAQRIPPRDAQTEGKKGTAVIRGKVTNTEGHPLRWVQLRLSGETIPEGRTARTNAPDEGEPKQIDLTIKAVGGS